MYSGRLVTTMTPLEERPSSDAPEPVATSYTTIQPSGASYKPGSIKEGFICSAIWAVLAAALTAGLRLWMEHAHPEKGLLSAEEWGELIGFTVGQFIVMGICLSSVVFYRRRSNVTTFILIDWRWWLVCFILALLPNKI